MMKLCCWNPRTSFQKFTWARDDVYLLFELWCCMNINAMLFMKSGWNSFFHADVHMNMSCCSKTLKMLPRIMWNTIGCCLFEFSHAPLFHCLGRIAAWHVWETILTVSLKDQHIYHIATVPYFIWLIMYYFFFGSIFISFDCSSHKIHNIFNSIPNFMKFFASCPVWCLLFYHDFYWFFDWLDF